MEVSISDSVGQRQVYTLDIIVHNCRWRTDPLDKDSCRSMFWANFITGADGVAWKTMFSLLESGKPRGLVLRTSGLGARAALLWPCTPLATSRPGPAPGWPFHTVFTEELETSILTEQVPRCSCVYVWWGHFYSRFPHNVLSRLHSRTMRQGGHVRVLSPSEGWCPMLMEWPQYPEYNQVLMTFTEP